MINDNFEITAQPTHNDVVYTGTQARVPCFVNTIFGKYCIVCERSNQLRH
jgi:hypothetical protein